MTFSRRKTLEKYMEMLALLEELNSPELAEALKRLQENASTA
jgi:hypothetical protein